MIWHRDKRKTLQKNKILLKIVFDLFSNRFALKTNCKQISLQLYNTSKDNQTLRVLNFLRFFLFLMPYFGILELKMIAITFLSYSSKFLSEEIYSNIKETNLTESFQQ